MLNLIKEQNFKGKKVIARFDFNVPLNSGKITDTTRLDLSLPTIKFLLEQGAKKVVLMSHLGRPKGKVDKKLSLEPVAKYLAEALKEEVLLSESATDRGIKTLLNLPTNKIILLENLRFHKEETENDPDFSKVLASYGDIYVNDAFGTCHRAHASTHGIVSHFQHKDVITGLLIENEITALNKVLESPRKPFVGVVGGAKVSDKIKIVERLLGSVDNLIIGGAMAYPFLKSQGHEVGGSLCSDEDVTLAKSILNSKNKDKIVLPLDHLCAEELDGDAVSSADQNIEQSLMGLDIGSKTINEYNSILKEAKTVIWNGPMGLFENKKFAEGTLSIAKALASNEDCFTLVGGGDSVSAVNMSGLSDKVGHISTGGGASLEYIEKGTLPGIQALKHGVTK